MRAVALGRRSWTFAGSDRGGERAAVIYSIVATCKFSGIDPRVCLADVLARIAEHPAGRLANLLPYAASRIMPRQRAFVDACERRQRGISA